MSHPATRAAPNDAHGSFVDDGLNKMEIIIINTIWSLAMDGMQKANSAHPGTPMAMALVAYTIWSKFLNFDPLDPI